MSLRWDAINLVPNLVTLSNLRRGDHLSVLKEGENVGSSKGNRGLRERFKIKRGLFKEPRRAEMISGVAPESVS